MTLDEAEQIGMVRATELLTPQRIGKRGAAMCCFDPRVGRLTTLVSVAVPRYLQQQLGLASGPCHVPPKESALGDFACPQARLARGAVPVSAGEMVDYRVHVPAEESHELAADDRDEQSCRAVWLRNLMAEVLSERERRIVLMRMEGMSYRDMAEIVPREGSEAANHGATGPLTKQRLQKIVSTALDKLREKVPGLDRL
jgi:hypothetical protein